MDFGGVGIDVTLDPMASENLYDTRPQGLGLAANSARQAAASSNSDGPQQRSGYKAPAQRPYEAALSSAVRRLEQRLETDRRASEQKLQRLERRLEEVATASCASGRWAELQGYVDGLGETVQDLVRRFECSAQAHLGRATPQNARTNEFEDHGTVGDSAMRELGEQLSLVCAQVVGLGTRLDRTENAAEAFASQQDVSRVCQQVGEVVARMEAAERRIKDVASSVAEAVVTGGAAHATVACSNVTTLLPGENGAEDAMVVDGGAVHHFISSASDCSSAWGTSGDCMDWAAEAAALRSEMRAQADCSQRDTVVLDTRLNDVERGLRELEQGLQDMRMEFQVRQQVGQVGEQMMRLALARTQDVRGARNGRADGVSATGAEAEAAFMELEAEVGAMGEDVALLQGQVVGLESGLDGMSKALDRVCEELASLRNQVGGCPEGVRIASGRHQKAPDPIVNRESLAGAEADAQTCRDRESVKDKVDATSVGVGVLTARGGAMQMPNRSS
mmetsp:Transcript_73671/g.204864  ORF Transcript_73671/g.204864 Transcript_73671/m.204864 type:complete len:505 (-) Transcript_73671:7-1521(-)